MGAEIRKRWDLDSKALGFEEKVSAICCGTMKPIAGTAISKSAEVEQAHLY